MQKKFIKKIVFVGILKVNDENSQRHGSAGPDPDPHQNVIDPKHCLFHISEIAVLVALDQFTKRSSSLGRPSWDLLQ
jgi:hypothetical protein